MSKEIIRIRKRLLDDYRAEILQYKSEGMKPVEICRKLNMEHALSITRDQVGEYLARIDIEGPLDHTVNKLVTSLEGTLIDVKSKVPAIEKLLKRLPAVEDSIVEKLDNNIDTVLSDLMSVALIGAYSYGPNSKNFDNHSYLTCVAGLDKLTRLREFLRSDDPLKDQILNVNIQVKS